MNRRDDYTQQREEQLDDLTGEIDRLREQAQEVDETSRIETLQLVDRLRAQQEIARHKLYGLQQADDDAWQDLKPGVDIAWKNLHSAVKAAIDQ